MERRCDQLAQTHAGAGSTNIMLEYAVQHWSAHARKASSLGEPLLKHPSGFFDERSIVRSWWYHREAARRQYDGLPRVSDTISLSAYIGFIPWIERVLVGGWLRQPALNKKTDWHHGRESPLVYAADQGHSAVMRILFERGATADWCKEAPDRDPAIVVFAASGNEMAVRICIEYGTKLGSGPLHIAAQNGYHAVVQLLLAAGADCEAKTAFNTTALMRAASCGHGAVVQVLLDFGAEVGATDHYKESALILAAANRHYHVTRMLLDRGAPLDDAMALWLAARQGNEAEVGLLLDRGVPVDTKTPRDVTALYCAAIEGHNDVVQVLIDRGAKIEAIAKAFNFVRGKPIMHVITTSTFFKEEKRFGRVVHLCCKAGVDINAVEDRGHTALHLAVIHACHPYEETETQLQALLDHGAKVDAEDEKGWTSLHHACRRGLRSAIIRILLDYGAQADARDHRGRTPLHLSAHFILRPDSAQLLLDHGADFNARDNEGRTPLDYAHGVNGLNGDLNSFLLRSLGTPINTL
jgi:ankyrin repeat protein